MSHYRPIPDRPCVKMLQHSPVPTLETIRKLWSPFEFQLSGRGLTPSYTLRRMTRYEATSTLKIETISKSLSILRRVAENLSGDGREKEGK